MADFEDEFTDTENTELTAHTPDVGTAWVKDSGSGTDNARINASNQVKAENNSGKDTIIGDDMSSADMQIWAFFPAFNVDAPNARMCARMDGSADGYAGGIAKAGGSFKPSKRVSGSTTLWTGFGDTSVGTWVKIKCEGDTITWFQSQQATEPTNPEEDTNWTQVHQETVTDLSTEMSHGFMLWGTSFQDSTANPLVGSYRASALTMSTPDSSPVMNIMMRRSAGKSHTKRRGMTRHRG